MICSCDVVTIVAPNTLSPLVKVIRFTVLREHAKMRERATQVDGDVSDGSRDSSGHLLNGWVGKKHPGLSRVRPCFCGKLPRVSGQDLHSTH